jgi:hypothetical protein
MELSPSREAASCALTQELPSALWKPKVYCWSPTGPFPSSFPIKSLHAFRFSPNCATCPANQIPFELIVLIILGEE